jgi:hypothetical protein
MIDEPLVRCLIDAHAASLQPHERRRPGALYRIADKEDQTKRREVARDLLDGLGREERVGWGQLTCAPIPIEGAEIGSDVS